MSRARRLVSAPRHPKRHVAAEPVATTPAQQVRADRETSIAKLATEVSGGPQPVPDRVLEARVASFLARTAAAV